LFVGELSYFLCSLGLFFLNRDVSSANCTNSESLLHNMKPPTTKTELSAIKEEIFPILPTPMRYFLK